MKDTHRLPLFLLCGSSLDRFAGVDIKGAHSKKLWHRFLIMPCYRVLSPIVKRYYRLRYHVHPRYKFHLIDTGLPPGPHLNSRRIMYGLFAILIAHVEEREGGLDALRESTDYLRNEQASKAPKEWIERQANDQQEMLELYLWWTTERPHLVIEKKARAEEIYGDEPLLSFDNEPETNKKHVTLRHIPSEDRKSLRELETNLNRLDDQMLTRLILLRKALD
jgi:hypothetical protein